jgi:hypothetical protein
MASPLQTGKSSADLAPSGAGAMGSLGTSKRAPGSKIRRDPPAPVAAKELKIPDPDQRDARIVVVGILLFTLILVAIMIGVASMNGWSPREYVAHV